MNEIEPYRRLELEPIPPNETRHRREMEYNQTSVKITERDYLRDLYEFLPFQIYSYSGGLFAAPGVFCDEPYAIVSELSPSVGTWYLQGHLTINATTGVQTATAVEWVTTEGTNTTTDFYTTIAQIEVTAGPVVDVSTVTQYNYGPIVGIIHGGYAQMFDVTFF